MRNTLGALALVAIIGGPAVALAADNLGTFETQDYPVRVERIAGGLVHPWGMAFLPDHSILVTERPGRLRLVRDGRLDPEPIAGLPPIAEHGQGGLLGVALHPHFTDNHLIYLSYAARGPGGVGTQVARGRLVGHRLADLQVIYRAWPKTTAREHFGSRLLFGADGDLYVTLGERGNRRLAQDLAAAPGSIVRLHDDGTVPPDNPFVNRPGAAPAIYSYGHRNPQGLTLDPRNGTLWETEHGPQGGDELNIIGRGANYGWPVITYGKEYGSGADIGVGAARSGMEQPVYYWLSSIAPSGLALYLGERFPSWRGDLFVGSLKFNALVRLTLDGAKVVGEERMLKGVLGRIRDVRAGPDGFLYLLSDEANGVLVRLVPATGG